MLVSGDLLTCRGYAKTNTNRVIKEDQAEQSIPRGGVRNECKVLDVLPKRDPPGAKLIEVANHRGAARAALEPNEEGGLG